MENQVRGLTTAGLLHLVAQIIQNREYARNRKKVVNLRAAIQAEPGLQRVPLPEKVGTHILRDLAKKFDWINAGNTTDAWRAKNAQGLALEQHRGELYDFVAQNAAYLFAQQSWPPTRPAGAPKGTPSGPSQASSLNELFAGSNYFVPGAVDEKGKHRHPQTFQERLDGVRALWVATQRDAEPGARQVSARGGFQRGPANQAQALAAINGGTYDGKAYPASNGFVVEKLAEFLGAKVNAKDPAVTPAPNATPQQLAQIAQTNESLRQRHQGYKRDVAPRLASFLSDETARQNWRTQLEAIANNQSVSAKDLKAMIMDLSKNPADLHRAIVSVNNALGGRLADLLWEIASTARVGNVLSGYNIAKPQIGFKPKVGTEKDVALREWVWLPGVQADGSDPVANPVGYTRFVFNAMMQAYLARGAAGNSAGYQQASSTRGAARGAKGIRGPDDRSLIGLDWKTDKGKKKVATFVRNAVQHQYSMEALIKGAQALNIQVNTNATLHDTVISQIREAIVTSLGPLADQGDQWALRAVGAALGMSGTFGAADIRTKIDAKYGIMSSNDCNSFSAEDLKHIAKGASHTLKGKTKEEDCRELQALAAQNKIVRQGSASISGRRQNEPSAAPRALKARGGKKAASEINALMNTNVAMPALSPRTSALFGMAARPTQPAFIAPPATNAFPAPVSPRQSPRGVVEVNGAQINAPRRTPAGSQPGSPRNLPVPPTVGGGLLPTSNTTSVDDMLNLLNGL